MTGALDDTATVDDAGNPQAAFAQMIAGTCFEDLPPTAVERAKVFVLDTLGVGLAGTTGVCAAAIADAVAGWGAGDEARLWLDGRRVPAGSAALANAYFIHCLEYDCVHEAAVVHAMAPVLSAALAFAERRARDGRPVSGQQLITGLALGVDLAASLGMAAREPMRFFRPATAGAFGATAALAHLAGFDVAKTENALGLVYGQISGTLQPHLEGSPLLALQMGFNARAALQACDLAEAGLVGPHDAICGRYGYLRLFENDAFDLAPIRAVTGGGPDKPWRIAELSHKPFPSGRLTHGVVDGLRRLQAEHGFATADVEKVTVLVPPLVHRLTGRPDRPEPDETYARLCLPFVAGVFLARGRVDVPDFRGAALTDPAVHELAARVEVVPDDRLDPNAITPQTVRVQLADGCTLEVTLAHVYGHPQAPLSRAEQLDKFRRCCTHAARPPAPARIEALIETVERLETEPDVGRLIDLMVA